MKKIYSFLWILLTGLQVNLICTHIYFDARSIVEKNNSQVAWDQVGDKNNCAHLTVDCGRCLSRNNSPNFLFCYIDRQTMALLNGSWNIFFIWVYLTHYQNFAIEANKFSLYSVSFASYLTLFISFAVFLEIKSEQINHLYSISYYWW